MSVVSVVPTVQVLNKVGKKGGNATELHPQSGQNKTQRHGDAVFNTETL